LTKGGQSMRLIAKLASFEATAEPPFHYSSHYIAYVVLYKPLFKPPVKNLYFLRPNKKVALLFENLLPHN